MTTLSTDKPRAYELGDYGNIPVIASDVIYEGAAVGVNSSGYARPLTAGDIFGGFADANADNSKGSAGDVSVRVRRKGLIQMAISGLAVTDIGKPVYASDDDTFTLTSTSNSHVGRVVRFVATGVGIVAFNADRSGAGLLTLLTDSSTGTANDTVTDVGSSFNQANINSNFADLVKKVNAIVQMLI